MGITFRFPWEIAFIEWIQANMMHNRFILAFLSLITELGDEISVVLLVVFFYWIYDKKLGAYLAINVICAETFNALFKNIVNRRRPYFDEEKIECLKAVDDRYDIYDIKGQGFSFPSGHSACAGSATTSVYRYTKNKKLLWIFSIIYGLVCFSRFALGVHYPTDVITGIVLGVGCAFIVPYIFKKFKKGIAYLVIIAFAAIGILFCKSNDYFSCFGLLCGFAAGDLFENRFVDFRNTRNVLKAILRLILGAALFLLISESMKIPFSIDFLEADMLTSHLFRSFRYGVSTFVIIGIYPMLFKLNILKLDDRMKG